MLEQDIQKAIEANLPAQIGKVLQERLAKVDMLEQQNSQLTLNLEQANEQVAKHYLLDSRTNDLKRATEAVTKREAEVAAREIKQDLKDAKAAAAEDKCKAIFELAAMAFRNPRVMRFETESRQEPVGGGQYGTTNTSSNKTTTETVE